MTCTHGYCSHGLLLTRRSDPSGLSHSLAGACDPTCSQERVIQKLEKVVEQSLQDAKRGRSAVKTVPRVPYFPSLPPHSEVEVTRRGAHSILRVLAEY